MHRRVCSVPVWSSLLAGLCFASILWSGGGRAEATVWNVSTVTQLQNAVNSANPYDEIVIAAGTYTLGSRLNINDHHLILRGATGNRDDVVLVGAGMNVDAEPREVIDLHVDDVTIRDLTVSECFWNGIHIRGEQDVDRTYIANVKTLNVGERHIKGSLGGSYTVDGVVIEGCYLLQTKPRQNAPDNDYIGGIDMMALNVCQIRDSVFQNIQGATGGGRGGIFLWNGSADCTAERNVFTGCDRSIAFGNPSGSPYHMTRGIARNNFVVRGAGIAVEMAMTRDTKVFNNTISSPDATYYRTIHINGSTENLQLSYNIIRGQLSYTSGGTATLLGNIQDGTGAVVVPGWFVNAGAGDLHLTSLATAAIDHAASVPEVTDDFDEEARPAGLAPDVGADEFQPPEPVLLGSEPAADGTLPKTQNNVILLTFDSAISLPGVPALSIINLHDATDVSASFTYSIEPDGVTLKAKENGAVLTNLNWYRVAPGAGFGVQAFVRDFCTLQGDADGSGQVLAQDYFPVKNNLFLVTDARIDLDGNGQVLAQDYFVVKNHLFDGKPPKP